MRAHEVEIGATYQVRPQHDHGTLAWLFSGPDEFELTVTGAGAMLGEVSAVVGVRVIDRHNVSLPLPPEQARRMGLPPGVDYLVQGVLVDAASGALVSRPTMESVTVPVSWLFPVA
ncbi:hypothetical protein [Crossiella sp. CA198]|uniref:hypothetical protein n=1 Tax=Crossiella sp. CA198 TaxID=3455607 RepID=UPI003F8D25ED